MADSVRSFAACIGITGRIRLLRDFFGFFRGRVPPDPDGVTSTISLKRQIGLLKGDHFHVNVIRIGSDNFTDNDNVEIDYAIYKMRNVYDNRSIGVGRVQHYGVLVEDADGLDNITTDGEVTDVTNRWVVRNDGIDLFIPDILNVTSSSGGNLLGRSPVPGPCEGKDSKGMNGAVTGIWGDEQTARTMAHELGHYLGLSHRNGSPDNLMAQSSVANDTRDSVDLTSGQGSTVRNHCLVDDGC